MNNLGNYYQIHKDYKKMLKYYLMAIEKGDSIAMSNLGYYYQEQKDYKNMVKYYILGVKYKNINCMHILNNYSTNLIGLKSSNYPYFIDNTKWLTDYQLEYLEKLKHNIKKIFKCVPTINNYNDVIIIAYKK